MKTSNMRERKREPARAQRHGQRQLDSQQLGEPACAQVSWLGLQWVQRDEKFSGEVPHLGGICPKRYRSRRFYFQLGLFPS